MGQKQTLTIFITEDVDFFVQSQIIKNWSQVINLTTKFLTPEIHIGNTDNSQQKISLTIKNFVNQLDGIQK